MCAQLSDFRKRREEVQEGKKEVGKLTLVKVLTRM